MRKQIIVILIFLSLFFLTDSAKAALNCSYNYCPSGGIQVLKMSASSNAHAGLPSSSYANYICCSGISGTSCSGGTPFLKLSATSGAHVQQTSYSSYSTSACLSPISGESINCIYSTSCTSPYVCLASISGATNAHVGNCSTYSTKVCCRTIITENDPPTCNYLQVNPPSGDVPLTVSFTASGSDSDGTVVQYEFTFGDDTSPVYTSNPGATHQYTISKTYCAKVRFQDNSGNWSSTPGDCPSSCATNVTVNPPGAAVSAPGVITNAASSVTQSSAILNGYLNSLGYNPSTCANCKVIVWFEWGTNPTPPYGNVTTAQVMTGTGSFSASIGVSTGQTYYFRARAKNGGSW